MPEQAFRIVEAGQGIIRIEPVLEKGIGSFLKPVLETGASSSVRVAALLIGAVGKPGEWTKRLLRLAKMGGVKPGNLPEKSSLFLKFSLPPFAEMLFHLLGGIKITVFLDQQVANLIDHGRSGLGIDGRRGDHLGCCPSLESK